MGWHPWHFGENSLFIGFKKTFRNLVWVKSCQLPRFFFREIAASLHTCHFCCSIFLRSFYGFGIRKCICRRESMQLKFEMMTMHNPNFSVRPDQEMKFQIKTTHVSTVMRLQLLLLCWDETEKIDTVTKLCQISARNYLRIYCPLLHNGIKDHQYFGF